MLQIGLSEIKRSNDPDAAQEDSAHMAWFDMDRTTKQRDQHLGANLSVRAPVIGVRQIVRLVGVRPEVHNRSGWEFLPHSLLGFGESSWYHHASIMRYLPGWAACCRQMTSLPDG